MLAPVLYAMLDAPRCKEPPPVPLYRYEKYEVVGSRCPLRYNVRWTDLHGRVLWFCDNHFVEQTAWQHEAPLVGKFSFAGASAFCDKRMVRPNRVQIDKEGNPVYLGNPAYTNTKGMSPVYEKGRVVRYERDVK